MIAGLNGIVVEAGLDGVVLLACGPVTVELALPPAQAAELGTGAAVQLSTYLHLATQSDTLKLYGFTSRLARDLFAVLITGSGIGPRVALNLLNLGAPALAAAVRDGDERLLTTVSGVGPKLAKKICLELGEKVGKEFGAAAEAAGRPAGGLPVPAADALEAAVALGFPRAQAEAALASARKEYGGDDTAELIRRLLAALKS
jgi:holliday junction DNA helicase RuvA